MFRAVREERIGRDLIDPREWAVIVGKICETHEVSWDDAETALDQAAAFVVTVAERFEVIVEKICPSRPVDQAWQVWRANPLQYSKIAHVVGAHVDRLPTPHPASPREVIHTAELIQNAGFALHREAWYGQAGASSLGLVKARLPRRQASA
jgi:hypothetical protein